MAGQHGYKRGLALSKCWSSQLAKGTSVPGDLIFADWPTWSPRPLEKRTYSYLIWRVEKLSRQSGEEVAADHGFWDHILLPITMGVLGPAVGVVPVDAACLTFDGEGMLIAGDSGAGKSTLSVALAQNGFGYISDDWSYLAMHSGQITAHGMSVPAKLLPDAMKHFPALARYSLAPALNGELAYELSPNELGAQVRLSV